MEPVAICWSQAMNSDTIQQLLGHTDWLRALALQLLRCPHAAEELVQETWVAALQRPPQVRDDSSNLRGWLARTSRNLAISRLRRNTRRERRERDVGRTAQAHVESSVEESLDRIAIQRAIAGAILQLEAEDREVIVLRYFDEVPPREIARRLGTSSSAVRSRLSRALGKLRGRLDQDFGGDNQKWVVAVAGVACGGGSNLLAPSILGGVWIMKQASTWLWGLALIVFATLMALTFDQWTSLGPSNTAEGRAGPLVTKERGAKDEAAPILRTLVEETSKPVGDEAQTATGERPTDKKLIIIARCVDREGNPLVGVTMTASELVNRPETVSGDDGLARLELRWPPQRTSGNNHWANVDFTGPALAKLHRQEAIKGAETVQLGDVTLQAGGAVRGFVIGADGRPMKGAWVRPVKPTVVGSPELEEERRVSGRIPGIIWYPQVRTDQSGAYVLPGVPAGAVSILAGGHGCYYAYSHPVDVQPGAEVRAPDLHLRFVQDMNTIRGIVHDENGQVIGGATVQAFENHGPRNINSIARARTKPSGVFELSVVSATAYTLQIDRQRLRRSLVLDDIAAGTQDLKVRFRPLKRIEVSAIDVAGQPLLHPRVSLQTSTGFGLLVRAKSLDETTEVIDVPEQAFILSVIVPGYRAKSFGPFSAESVPKRIEAILEILPMVSGQVFAGGKSVAGAKVHLHPLARSRFVRYAKGLYGRLAGRQRMSRIVTTDAEGRFDVPFYSSGKAVVHAKADGFARAESMVIELGTQDIHGIALRLVRGGTLEGQVKPGPGAVAEGSLVAATNGDGHLRTQLVGPDGTYRFDTLSPGPWHLILGEVEDRQWLREGRTWPESRIGALPTDVTIIDARTSKFDLGLTPKRGR